MLLTKNVFLEMLDNCFQVSDTDIKTRFAKCILLSYLATADDDPEFMQNKSRFVNDYGARLLYCRYVLGLYGKNKDIEKVPESFVSIFEALEVLGHFQLSKDIMSDNMKFESLIIGELEAVTYETMHDCVKEFLEDEFK